MTEFRCDPTDAGTPFPHPWEACVGSGHATLALRRDWLAQLRRCHDELGVQAVRFHGILSDDVGTFTVQQGQDVDSFFNAFQIYDGILDAGMKPFVELSFMPRALARGDQTVFHYAGNVTPPRDPDAWAALIRRFAAALVTRYGAEEVRTWHFEVWNEPNLADFWAGTQADYFDLYRWTAQALKEVDAGLRVGGPATAANAWIADFVGYTESAGLPLDFVSTHHYPTDSFGHPGDDTEKQLAASQRGALREQAQDAVRNAGGRPVLYTEWCTTSNPFFWRNDDPYAAAFVAKSCLDVAETVQAYSYWTFSDIFEENYFSSAPFHGGFGLLTIHGVAKPAYRAMQLLHGLGDERLVVDGMHPTVDCTVTRRGDDVVVLLTNHALPAHAIAAAPVRLRLAGAPGAPAVEVERIDAGHANARRAWEAMGEPATPTPEQIEALHAASEVGRETVAASRDGADLTVEVDVPAHAVVRLTVPGAARTDAARTDAARTGA